ncbi:hypothetical protein D3C76_1476340 [compost metagenome]
MTATTPPKRPIRRPLGFVLLLALPLLAYAAVQYQQAAAREQAAELAAYCAEPASGSFSLKLACIPRRDQ